MPLAGLCREMRIRTSTVTSLNSSLKMNSVYSRMPYSLLPHQRGCATITPFPKLLITLLRRAGFEPATFGLWDQRATAAPPRNVKSYSEDCGTISKTTSSLLSKQRIKRLVLQNWTEHHYNYIKGNLLEPIAGFEPARANASWLQVKRSRPTVPYRHFHCTLAAIRTQDPQLRQGEESRTLIKCASPLLTPCNLFR